MKQSTLRRKLKKQQQQNNNNNSNDNNNSSNNNNNNNDNNSNDNNNYSCLPVEDFRVWVTRFKNSKEPYCWTNNVFALDQWGSKEFFTAEKREEPWSLKWLWHVRGYFEWFLIPSSFVPSLKLQFLCFVVIAKSGFKWAMSVNNIGRELTDMFRQTCGCTYSCPFGQRDKDHSQPVSVR